MSTWLTAFWVFLCFRVTVDGYLQSILTGVVVRLARQKLVAWHFYGHLLFEVGWPLEMYICMAFSSMDEEVGFHISCFEWTLGECGQPKKLIPEGQGILAFASHEIRICIKRKKITYGKFFDETCSTICGTHVQAILDQKNLTGLAGGSGKVKIMHCTMCSL